MIGGGIMTNSVSKTQVKPLLWENLLLLSLDVKWIDVFGFIPSFDVMIENGRLILLGPKLPQRGDKND